MNLIPGGGPLALVAFVVFLVWVGVTLKRRRRRGGVGPGLAGAFYELLPEERRQATQVIVERRTGERRPEYPDGTPPVRDESGSGRN
jgi:hypothetical protein